MLVDEEETKTQIKLFEEQKLRTVWDSEKEEWYFSVVDVVQILTDSKDPKQYIKKMRSRDEQLNLNWGTICTPVQMLAAAAMSRASPARRWNPKRASRSSPRRTPRASASSSPLL